MIQALVFDYNGVLVDDIRFHVESYHLAAKDLGYRLTPEEVRKYISFSPTEKRARYLGKVSDEQWNAFMKRKGDYYFKMVSENDVVFDTVKTALPSLAARYSLALITNTPREFFERVFPASLAGLFKVTLFADEVRRPKPDPEPLMTVLARFNLQKEQCCYIGDSTVDVRMAKAAGVPIFAVATGDNTYQELVEARADVVMRSLSELDAHLELSLSRTTEQAKSS